jgi:hypothetical protein
MRVQREQSLEASRDYALPVPLPAGPICIVYAINDASLRVNTAQKPLKAVVLVALKRGAAWQRIGHKSQRHRDE